MEGSPLALYRGIADALAADPSPFDPDRLDRRQSALIEAALPLFRAFNERYVRLRVEGREHLAGSAPTLFVGNHSGGIMGPDLPGTLATLWEARGASAPTYALAHDFAMRQLPPFGRVIQLFGAIAARPANAARVFARGGSVLVYPGGDLDAYRHSRRRNEVVFGGRNGFVRTAQNAGVPIVPIVVYGAHRSAYIFAEGKRIARAFGLPRWARIERFPLALAAPWGLSVGPWLPYLPLPFPLRMRVLPPMNVQGEEVNAARERVRAAMQSALESMARADRVG